MTLHTVPPILGRPDLQPLLTHTLALVELLDLHTPNLERQLAIDLLLSCGNLTPGQVTDLALQVLQDAAPAARDPQVHQLIGLIQGMLRTQPRPTPPRITAPRA